MPLTVNGNRSPALWTNENQESRTAISQNGDGSKRIQIAFVNNMPDAALEDTERQFFGLLAAAASEIPVHVSLYSLPNLPRSERGLQHLNEHYLDFNELLNSRFDAVIITGTEPRYSDLKQEPYWKPLANLLDWAQVNTISAVLSCLVAHASVLHGDGISRHALRDKQFGVFREHKVVDHPLTSGAPNLMPFPHSRWNEVRESELKSSGYSVLTRSRQAGVNLFVKKKKNSLFVHFQGHPEYGAETLFKEYRRDVRRFLSRERETYPLLPNGYFDAATADILDRFREKALHERNEQTAGVFPDLCAFKGLQNTWRTSATDIYRNWLQYTVSKKADKPAFIAIAGLRQEQIRHRRAYA